MADKNTSATQKDPLGFFDEPPITGGNSYTTKQVLESQSEFLKSTIPYKVKKQIDDISNMAAADARTNCYNLWYLLQLMADYFSNLIYFRFDNQQLTQEAYKAIRTACVFGTAAIIKTKTGEIATADGVKDVITPIAYYVASMETDGFGIPTKLKVYPSGGLFMNQSIISNYGDEKEFPKAMAKLTYIEVPYNEDVYILNYSAAGWGGLTKWLYFLKQFERILKMLYSHSYSYVKSIIYNVADRDASKEELKIFFSESPFLVNIGDDEILSNRFKPFELSGDARNSVADFLNSFIEIYYALLGRRSNVDYKKERNITSEIAMSGENYDTLQNEFKTYITLMLEWLEKEFSQPVIYNNFDTPTNQNGNEPKEENNDV